MRIEKLTYIGEILFKKLKDNTEGNCEFQKVIFKFVGYGGAPAGMGPSSRIGLIADLRIGCKIRSSRCVHVKYVGGRTEGVSVVRFHSLPPTKLTIWASCSPTF